MLAHYPLILGSLSPIIVVQVATPGCHHLRGTGRMGGCIEEILGRNRLSPRQAIIWGRSWRRITAIILASKKLRRHGVINLGYSGQ